MSWPSSTPPERPDHRHDPPPALYAGGMGWVIFLVVVVAVVVAWKMRVKLLAKILGQSESRVNRQLNRKK